MVIGNYGWGTFKPRCWTSFIGSQELLRFFFEQKQHIITASNYVGTAPEAEAAGKRLLQ